MPRSVAIANALSAAATGALPAGMTVARSQFDLLPAAPPRQRWQGASYNSTRVATFASGHGWTATAGNGIVALNDTAVPGPFSDQSISITNSTSTASYVEKTGLTLDLSASSITVWIKRDTPTVTTPNITLYLGDSALTNYYTITFSPTTIVDADANGWECYEFFPALMTAFGSPSLASVARIRFRLEASTPGALVVHLGAVTIRPLASTAYPNGIVTFTFDDSNASDFTHARPVLAAYDFPATCYLIADQTSAAKAANYRQMQQHLGWEIAGHAYTVANHDARYESLSDAAVYAEARDLRNWMDDHGFTSDAFASPGGTIGTAGWTQVRKFFNSHRTAGIVSGTIVRMQTAPPQRVFNIIAPTWAAGSLAQFQAAIDKAKAYKTWMLFNLHGVTSAASSGQSISSADLNTIAAYCQSQGVAVRTVEQVLHGSMI